MSDTLLAQLEERRAQMVAAMGEINDRSSANGGKITAEDSARFERLNAEVKEMDVQLKQRREDAERDARAARVYAGTMGQPGDVLQIRHENRLAPRQTMRQFLDRESRAQRAAWGAPPEREFDAGAYFRGMITGQWSERNNFERRALAEGTVAAGGALVPIDLFANVVDIVRNSARVLQSGATVVPLEHFITNVAKLVSDPVPTWRAEGSTISATGSTFTRLSFNTQTLATIVVVSRELLEDVPTLGDEIQRELALEFALALDLGALYGTGYASFQPNGVKNATWSVSQTSMGTNGAALSTLTPNAWMGVVNPCYRLLAVNEYGLSGAIMNPRTEKEMVTAASTINTFVEPPSRLASIARRGTAPLAIYSTNQIPVNLTQGSANTASDMFVGDWSQLLVGMRKELKIDVLNEAYAGTGQIGLLAWLRADVVVARPSAFDITVGIL